MAWKNGIKWVIPGDIRDRAQGWPNIVLPADYCVYHADDKPWHVIHVPFRLLILFVQFRTSTSVIRNFSRSSWVYLHISHLHSSLEPHRKLCKAKIHPTSRRRYLWMTSLLCRSWRIDSWITTANSTCGQGMPSYALRVVARSSSFWELFTHKILTSPLRSYSCFTYRGCDTSFSRNTLLCASTRALSPRNVYKRAYHQEYPRQATRRMTTKFVVSYS